MLAIGVDTGAGGAIARIQFDDGHEPEVAAWDLPRSTVRGARGLDEDALIALVATVAPEGTHAWIESNTGWPGEEPDLAFRHGLNSGQLRMALRCRGFITHLVAPSEWTGRLGLPGKTDDPMCRQRARFLSSKYMIPHGLLYGPRSGVLNGRCDALLIAHYGRLCLEAGGNVMPATLKSWSRRPMKGLYADDIE